MQNDHVPPQPGDLCCVPTLPAPCPQAMVQQSSRLACEILYDLASAVAHADPPQPCLPARTPTGSGFSHLLSRCPLGELDDLLDPDLPGKHSLVF